MQHQKYFLILTVSPLIWYKADISIISSNTTCSCHDIAEQLLFSFAHSGIVSFPIDHSVLGTFIHIV